MLTFDSVAQIVMSGAHSGARTQRPTSVWKNACTLIRSSSFLAVLFGAPRSCHAYFQPADIKACFMRFYVKAHALTAYISISPTFYCPISMIYIALEFATARALREERDKTNGRDPPVRLPMPHPRTQPSLQIIFCFAATSHIQFLLLPRLVSDSQEHI